MTRLFRSKSCGPGTNSFSALHSRRPSLSLYPNDHQIDEAEEVEGEEEEEEEEREEEKDEDDEMEEYGEYGPATTPFISPEHRLQRQKQSQNQSNNNNHQLPLLECIMAALRKSLVCSVERDDVGPLDIGLPTDVRHVSHVTFDRFNGFLGLPVDLQPKVPRKVPSASASVFGVSAKSMQCSYDHRGNSVPTILLMMQKRLYSEGGLQAEGIFRINAENSQEQNVRDRLNKGIVPRDIDVHCLAGLIKAWFRELPRGVLDTLTPEHVMHCNTEEDCTQLVKLLPRTEAALLDWVINLMADVVQQEHHNKMNARNIAMVFAPNMTQMADPLTALIHAVQVMNFLKTLITKTLREREESGATLSLLSSVINSPGNRGDHPSSSPVRLESSEQNFDSSVWEGRSTNKFIRGSGALRVRVSVERSISGVNLPGIGKSGTPEHGCRSDYENVEVEGILDKLSPGKGVGKLCSHPVFQLNKPVYKSGGLGIVNDTDGEGEAWA